MPKIDPFQERLGGRIALVTEIDVSGTKLVAYNLHLESRGQNELRVSQLQEVLDDAARQDWQSPIIVAGDLNLDASKSSAAGSFASGGFQDAISASGAPTTPARHLFETGHRIDWAFIRGPVRATAGRVHGQIRASDHFPISFTLTSSRG